MSAPVVLLRLSPAGAGGPGTGGYHDPQLEEGSEELGGVPGLPGVPVDLNDPVTAPSLADGDAEELASVTLAPEGFRAVDFLRAHRFAPRMVELLAGRMENRVGPGHRGSNAA